MIAGAPFRPGAQRARRGAAGWPRRRSADTARSASSPPPRCATAQAKRKWNGAPSLAGDRAQHSAERVAADEQRQGLVFVWRPGGQTQREKDGNSRRARRDDGHERPLGKRVAGPPRPRRARLPRPRQQPIPEACALNADLRVSLPERAPVRGSSSAWTTRRPRHARWCGASLLEKVLHPRADLLQARGFYSTDYGKGRRKRDSADGEKAKSTDGDKKPEKKEAGEARARLLSSASAAALAGRKKAPRPGLTHLGPCVPVPGPRCGADLSRNIEITFRFSEERITEALPIVPAAAETAADRVPVRNSSRRAAAAGSPTGRWRAVATARRPRRGETEKCPDADELVGIARCDLLLPLGACDVVVGRVERSRGSVSTRARAARPCAGVPGQSASRPQLAQPVAS